MNLFPRNRIPYFVWSPSYTHKSSGVRTLHLLVHALNEAGERAYLCPNNFTGYATNPELNTPLLSIQHQNFYEDRFIAVYPDIVKGNPFNAKHVVRMLLAPRGAYGGDVVFPDSDQVWGALPSIAENVLRVPVEDINIFYPPEEAIGLAPEFENSDIVKKEIPVRFGTCFYSWKYEHHGGQPLKDITGGSTRLVGSLEQIADTLRKSEMCYLYELTGVITEAALCKCPVTLVRTEYFNKIDPQAMMGDVKWSDGERVKHCDDYFPEYQKFLDDFPDQLQNFIQKTQGMLYAKP